MSGAHDASPVPLLTIVADDREAHNAVVEALQPRPGVAVKVQRLALGDYAVEECVFERKTVVDFAHSLVDGRLFSQARRLVLWTTRCALILEGHAAELPPTGVSREALLGAMVTLTLVFRLPVLRTWDAIETANLLCYAGEQLGRATDDVPLFHGRRPRQRRRQRLAVLQSLPGIGPKRAALLLDHFQTVAAVVAASPEALVELPGLGSATAHRMHDLLHTPWDPRSKT